MCTCLFSEGTLKSFWNEPRDSLESNYKGWFVGLIPSYWTLHEPDSVLVQKAGDMLLPNKQNLGAFFWPDLCKLKRLQVGEERLPRVSDHRVLLLVGRETEETRRDLAVLLGNLYLPL